MKARLLLSMAVGIGLAGAAAAQVPQVIPAPYQPTAAAPQPAAAPPATAPYSMPLSASAPASAAPMMGNVQPAPVIRYHVYGGAAAPCASCAGGSVGVSMLRDPFGACGGSCGSGAYVSGASVGCKSWLRDPYAAYKARCAEVKQACYEKSCGYGKTSNDFGCGGCKQDCDFIFGSCSQFFQEPCRRAR